MMIFVPAHVASITAANRESKQGQADDQSEKITDPLPSEDSAGDHAATANALQPIPHLKHITVTAPPIPGAKSIER